MVYLVSLDRQIFELEGIRHVSVEKSLEMLSKEKMLQYDSETTGLDPHINKLLCIQFGDVGGSWQIVIDCNTIDVARYAEVLEGKTLIGHNLKFDFQFLYNHGIKPLKCYDIMIVEQFLHLGYPPRSISYSLQETARRYLGVHIDKEIRGQIIWRGLDLATINYSANDVKYLKRIMDGQVERLKKIKNAVYGAKLECDFVPAIAYLEWCGIHLDRKLWQEKMAFDEMGRKEAVKKLNSLFVERSGRIPSLKAHILVDRQGDLFDGFDLTPKVTINWSSSRQAIQVFKALGFNTRVEDKKTGEDKDSVLEKVLKSQKGIDDEFLNTYLDFKEKDKLCSTYGQSYLDAINPNTERIHTDFRQLGTKSGRMACGSKDNNVELAKLNKVAFAGYPQLQNLPADKTTRSCFTAEEGNLFCSCDFSALESRLGADIYNEPAMLDEFLHGGGDMHSLCAKLVFHEELKDVEIKDIKKKRPDLRNKVKPIEFSQQFGGSAFAVQGQLGCTIEEAQEFVDAYMRGFSGIAKFKEKGSKLVKENGYVLMSPKTGHCMYWYDWESWKEEGKSFTSEFWEEYRIKHKGTGDEVAQLVKKHFQEGSKWDRMALNGPTQGQGIVLMKHAVNDFYRWIVGNGLFGKVKIVNLVHDECCIEFPETLPDVPKVLQGCMEKAASIYCEKLPIPAFPEIGKCWIH